MKKIYLKKLLALTLASALFTGTMEGFSVNAFAMSEYTTEATSEMSGEGLSLSEGNTIIPENIDSSATGAGNEAGDGIEAGAGTSNSSDILIIESNESAADASSLEISSDGSLDGLSVFSSESSSDSSSDASSEASSDAATEMSLDASTEASSEELPEDYYTVYPTGLRPDDGLEIESSFDGARSNGRLRAASLPSSYITELLPPLRSQGSYGTCWAFATTALAEIYMLNNYNFENGYEPDFSELHLAYFTYNTETDPLGGTEGDWHRYGASVANLDQGGRVEYGLNTYARWIGIADESIADYTNDVATAINPGLSPSIAYTDIAHVTNYYTDVVSKDVSTIAANKHQNIKQLVAEYGAAAISYRAKNSMSAATDDLAYNATTYAYYNAAATDLTENHAVVVVGWNDNFSRYNFSTTAPGDGAFLVRNSWSVGNGTSVDDNMGYSGYFWMSYYEPTLGKKVVAADFRMAQDGENVYEYDGGLYNAGTDNNKVANVFTAHAQGAELGEYVTDVSFATSYSNVNYEIKVYTDLNDPDDPESGILSSTLTGSTTYSGFYTLELAEPIYVSAGEVFSVVVTLSKAGSTPGVSSEYKFTNDPSHVMAEQGQSYYYDDAYAGWVDVATFDGSANFVIKAYTVKSGMGLVIDDLDAHNSLTLGVEEDTQISARILASESVDKELVWTSSDTSVATISGSGVISPLRVGTTTITVQIKDENIFKHFTVNVISKLLGLSVSSQGEQFPGETISFTAAKVPSSYSASQSIKWSTTTPELVKLDADTGKAKILKSGIISVTATLEDVSETVELLVFPSYTYVVNSDYSVTFTIDAVEGVTKYLLSQGDDVIDSKTAEEGATTYTLTDNTYVDKTEEERKTGTFELDFEVGEETEGFYVQIPLVGAKKIDYEVGTGILNYQSPRRYVPGETVELIAPVPSIVGIHFAGWYLDPEFTSEKRTSVLTTDNEDLKFYAKWEVNPVTGITLKRVDGNTNLDEIETGKDVVLTAVVEPEGDVLDSSFTWETFSSGGTTTYADIKPSTAATVSVNSDGNLVITPTSAGTIKVAVKSVQDPDITAEKTILMSDFLPQSIKFGLSDTSTDITTSETYGIDASYIADVKDNAAAKTLKSNLALTYKLYNVKNPDENSTLSANQEVEFTSSDEGIAVATKAASGVVNITIGNDAKSILSNDSSGKDYVTARITATAKVNKAVSTYIDVVIRKKASSSAGISLPELQITSNAKKPVVYASSSSGTKVDANGIELATGKSVTVKTAFVPAITDKSFDKTIVWASANTAVATVNNKGTITAKGAGEVVITATSPATGLTAAARVKVYDSVSSFAIDKKSMSMGFGQTAYIQVTTLLPTTASNEIVVKEIKNKAIASATYEGDGRIRIVAKSGSAVSNKTTKGAVVLTTAHGEKTVSCNVTVGNAVKSIRISAKGKTSSYEPFVAAGKTLQLQATFNNGDKQNQPASKELVWEIVKGDDTEGDATINAKGVLTARKEGYVTVFARSLTDVSGGEYVKSNELRVWIYVPVKKATLSKTAVTLSEEKEYEVYANITPAVMGANPGNTASGSTGGHNQKNVNGAGIETDVAGQITWKIKKQADAEKKYIKFYDPEASAQDKYTDSIDKLFKTGVKGQSLKIKIGKDLGLTRNVTIPITATFRPYGAKKDTVLNCNVTITDGLITKLSVSPSKIAMNRGAEADIVANLTPIVPKDSELTWEIPDDGSRQLIQFVGGNSSFAIKTNENTTEGKNAVRIKAVADDTATTKTKATVIVTTKGSGETGERYTSSGNPITVRITVDIGNQAKDIMITSGKLNVSWKDNASNSDVNAGKIVMLANGKSTTLKAAVFTNYGTSMEASATASGQNLKWTAPKDSVKAGNQKVVWALDTSEDYSDVVTISNKGVIKAIGTGKAIVCAYSADNSTVITKAIVYVYNAPTKITLDKTKATLGVTASNETSLSSLRNYDVVTPYVTPESVFSNFDRVDQEISTAFKDFDKVTWTVDAASSGSIKVCAVDTKTIQMAKDANSKQNLLANCGSYVTLTKDSPFATAGGKSLAIKALSPGTVKLKATAPGGKSVTCTITVYTHVKDLNLKLAWNVEESKYTSPITRSLNKEQFAVLQRTSDLASTDPLKESANSYDYVAKLDTRSLKSVTLTAIMDYYGGEGETIAYFDRKTTADEKALTTKYTNTKKFVVNSSVNYVSSNPQIVAVASNGTITAKRAGTAIITVSSMDSSFSKRVYVVVRQSSAGWFTKVGNVNKPTEGTYLTITEFGGAPNDGKSDTEAINKALIKAGKNAKSGTGKTIVYLPAGVYDLEPIPKANLWDRYIFIGERWWDGELRMNNISLIMDNEAILNVHTITGDNAYEVIHVELVDNVKIEGGQIQGERSAHGSKRNEDGHGIGIHGATNITISNMSIASNWGDGIYLAVKQYKNPITEAQERPGCKNITIKNCDIIDNTRNGISFTDADYVDVLGCYIYDCHGAAPQCGIYFEPNSDSSDGVCEHINIKNTIVTAYQNKNSYDYMCFMTHYDPDNSSYTTANDVTIEDCVFNGYFGNYSGSNMTLSRNTYNGGYVNLRQ